MDLYCTFTQFGDTVEDVADPALTAVRAHQVDTTMAGAHVACTTLVHICNTKRRNYISLRLRSLKKVNSGETQ